MTTCQHCGDETNSARAKQCKACAALKDDAYRYGRYPQVMAAFSAGAAAGVTGAALRELAQAADAEARIAQLHADAAQRAATQTRKEARKAGEAEVGRKMAAGWTWVRVDEESEDAFGATAFTDQYGGGGGFWTLVAPAPAA